VLINPLYFVIVSQLHQLDMYSVYIKIEKNLRCAYWQVRYRVRCQSTYLHQFLLLKREPSSFIWQVIT